MQQSIAQVQNDWQNSNLQPRTDHAVASEEATAQLETSNKGVRAMEVDSLADSFAQMSHTAHKHPPRKPRGRGVRIAL